MRGMKCLICGMTINEQNYNRNELSYTPINEKEDIKYCPFCGVSIDYISYKNDIYQIDVRSLDGQSVRILNNAMKLEIFNAEYYEEASKMAKDEVVKDFFRDLRNIEIMHAQIHRRLGGFSELPKLHKPDYSKHTTDELLLAEAQKREDHAVAFYRKNSSKVNVSIVKEVFLALSGVEKQHKAIALRYQVEV